MVEVMVKKGESLTEALLAGGVPVETGHSNCDPHFFFIGPRRYMVTRPVYDLMGTGGARQAIVVGIVDDPKYIEDNVLDGDGSIVLLHQHDGLDTWSGPRIQGRPSVYLNAWGDAPTPMAQAWGKP